MKKFYLLGLLFLSIAGLHAQTPYYYYYKGEKQYFELDTINDVTGALYFKDGIRLSNFFYVKLKSLSDTTLLQQEAEKENMVIVSQNEFMPLWFVASITANSRYNAMQAAAYFYETGLFQCAEPDLMFKWDSEFDTAFRSDTLLQSNARSDCANDSLFSQQWNLYNDGYGIKACDAWQLSTGANVVVALLDNGIKMFPTYSPHEDLAANIHSLSYDVENVEQNYYICSVKNYKYKLKKMIYETI
jgi:hypothetical protein